MRINRPFQISSSQPGENREFFRCFSLGRSQPVGSKVFANSANSENAFTMIEIAIAVGVIGFALVAIIGILPRGMNVQKDNREDTIISQDAPYFLNAIRNGEQRVNQSVLTNYVETIADTVIKDLKTNTVYYTNTPLLGLGTGNNDLPDDQHIIGLLSTPEYDVRNPNTTGGLITNEISMIVRAMSGSAITQSGQSSSTMAFRYQLTVENVPWNAFSPDSTNYTAYAAGPPASPDYTSRLNRFNALQYLTNDLHELRLKFAWPVFPGPNGTYNIGPGRQTYRTLISSHLALSNSLFNPWLWFYQPQYYTNNITSD
jgi:type II secretory pathway pseudopilin PulG